MQEKSSHIFLITLSFFTLVVGCFSCKITQEKVGSSEKNSKPKIVKLKENYELNQHKSDDPTCDKSRALKDLGEVNLWLWNSVSEKNEKFPVDLTGVRADPIRSQFVTGMIKNYKKVESYNNCQQVGDKSYKCNDVKHKEESKGENIFICKKEYGEKSLENMYLSMLASVNETSECFSNIPGAPARPPIEVLALPIFQTKITLPSGETKSFVDVNNAFWTTASRKPNGYTMAFLPHSKKVLKQKIYDHEFYRNLGIGAHEMGHHQYFNIASKLFTYQKGGSSTFVDNYDDFTNHQRLLNDGEDDYSFLNSLQLSQVQRKVDNRQIVAAINEGFADGISYFCGEGKVAYSLRFGSNKNARDLDLETVLNEKVNQSARYNLAAVSEKYEKVLSVEVLQHFFADHVTKQREPGVPNHQDIHTIGSYTMKGLNEVWEGYLDYKGIPKNKSVRSREKLKLLLAWLLSMNKYGLKKSQEPTKFMAELIYRGIVVSYIADKSLTQNQCDQVTKHFPYWAESWEKNHRCI
ncbi:MAG: hypothetical protein CMP11_05075 [Zetaproteobacteria bacterium]|nr:hypothetical protein [Pseudobdellovibrionaceae bacterium]|tara:strand:- start:1540 stop:3105 length:1566 start_codon:yes stop_codon:yes gene_type:complete